MTQVPFTCDETDCDEADIILRGVGRSGHAGINASDGLIAAVAAGPIYIATHEWLA